MVNRIGQPDKESLLTREKFHLTIGVISLTFFLGLTGFNVFKMQKTLPIKAAIDPREMQTADILKKISILQARIALCESEIQHKISPNAGNCHELERLKLGDYRQRIEELQKALVQ